MPYDPKKHNRRSMRLKGYDYAQAGAYFVTICTQNRMRFFQNTALYRIAAQCWQAIPEHASSVELDEWVIMPDHIHGIIVIADFDDAGRDDRDDRTASLRTGVQLNAPPANRNESRRRTDDDKDRHRMGVQLNAPPATSDEHDELLRTGVQLNAPPANSTEHDELLRTGVQLNAPPANHKDPQRYAAQHAAPTTRDPSNRFSAISPYRDTLAVIVRTYKAAVTTLCRRAGYDAFGWQRNYHERIIRTEADLNRIRQYIMNNPSNWRWSNHTTSCGDDA